ERARERERRRGGDTATEEETVIQQPAVSREAGSTESKVKHGVDQWQGTWHTTLCKHSTAGNKENMNQNMDILGRIMTMGTKIKHTHILHIHTLHKYTHPT